MDSDPLGRLERMVREARLGCAACGAVAPRYAALCIYVRARDGHHIGYVLCERCMTKAESSEQDRERVMLAVEARLEWPLTLPDGRCLGEGGKA